MAASRARLAELRGGGGWSIGDSSHNHTGSTDTFLAPPVLRPQHDRVYAIAAVSETIHASDDDAGLLKSLLSALIQRFET